MGSVTNQVALIVECPLVGMAKFFINPLASAENLGNGFARPGEENTGRVDHCR